MDNFIQNPHNVVTMAQHITSSGFSALAQVGAYWEALRGARLMPNRAEIDPRGIEVALEYSFIVERIAPGIARLRIAGSHLNDLMGMEVRGMPLTSFITAGSRRQVSDTLEEVFETPATCTLHLMSEANASQSTLEARMLLMPLKSDLGDVSRILGVLVSQGDIGRSPRRFDVTRCQLRPILAGTSSVFQAPVTPSKPNAPPKPATTATPLVAGFAEPKVPFKASTPRREAPYLRLVKNDD